MKVEQQSLETGQERGGGRLCGTMSKNAVYPEIGLKLEKTRAPKLSGPLDGNLVTDSRRNSQAPEHRTPQFPLPADGDEQMNYESKMLSELESAKVASQQLRQRITISTTVLGGACMLASLGLNLTAMLLTTSTINQRPLFGLSEPYFSISFFFAAIMSLNIMPNDTVLVRLVSWLIGNLCVAFGLFFFWIAWDFWIIQRAVLRQPGNNDHECGENMPNGGCVAIAGLNIINGFSCIIVGFAIRRNVQTHRKSLFKESLFKESTENQYAIPTRAALARFWMCFRLFSLSFGIYNIAFAVICGILGEKGAPFFTRDVLVVRLLDGAVEILVFFFFSKRYRTHAIVFLSSINSMGEVKSAACLSALLGGIDPKVGLKQAKDAFRCIAFSKLHDHDFVSNANSGNANSLFDKTSPAKLGDCDVFLSHSWSDDGLKKYGALKTWAKEFTKREGRDPYLWLDKACINQNNISSQLLFLPIFLSGCKRLLIIAGRTYTERLWCLIEVFTFLKMGGTLDRVTILHIEMSEMEASIMFRDIDIVRSKCFLESDKQKLLGIVEYGFGNANLFNEVIRDMFKSRHKTVFQIKLERDGSTYG
jgi:hypothetical protein